MNSKTDERLDPKKSTAAACRYILSLRQTLGPDTSLLVTVAAYNLGPEPFAVSNENRSRSDRQNDFWHLYSTRRIPRLTRTHIARLMAAIIIGRNEERFGFGRADATEKIARLKMSEENSSETSGLASKPRLKTPSNN